jgi:hypothetical protein
MGGRSSSQANTATTVTAQNQQTTGDANVSTSVGAGGAISTAGNIVQGMQGGTVVMTDPGGVALAQAANAAVAQTAQVGLVSSGQVSQQILEESGSFSRNFLGAATDASSRLSENMLASASAQTKSAADTIQALAANARQATTEAGAIASGGGVSQIQKWIPIAAMAAGVVVLVMLFGKKG